MAVKTETRVKLVDVRTKSSLDTDLNNISESGILKIKNLITQMTNTVPYWATPTQALFDNSISALTTFLEATANNGLETFSAYLGINQLFCLNIQNNTSTSPKINYDPSSSYPGTETSYGSVLLTSTTAFKADSGDTSWLNQVCCYESFLPTTSTYDTSYHFKSFNLPRTWNQTSSIQKYIQINTDWLIQFLRSSLLPQNTGVSGSQDNFGFQKTDYALGVDSFFTALNSYVGRRIIANCSDQQQSTCFQLDGTIVSDGISSSGYPAIVGNIIVKTGNGVFYTSLLGHGGAGTLVFVTGWSDVNTYYTQSLSGINNGVKYWIL